MRYIVYVRLSMMGMTFELPWDAKHDRWCQVSGGLELLVASSLAYSGSPAVVMLLAISRARHKVVPTTMKVVF